MERSSDYETSGHTIQESTVSYLFSHQTKLKFSYVSFTLEFPDVEAPRGFNRSIPSTNKSKAGLHRVVHGSDGPAGRVGSGRVTNLPVFGGSGRVGSELQVLHFATDLVITCLKLRIIIIEAKHSELQ